MVSPPAARAWLEALPARRDMECTVLTVRPPAARTAYMARPGARLELGRSAQRRRPAGRLMACTEARPVPTVLASRRSRREEARGLWRPLKTAVMPDNSAAM